MAIDDEGDYFSNPFDVYEEPEPLTVAQARELATAKQMQDIFGERLGAR